jgi:L-cysteine/cystine lyase
LAPTFVGHFAMRDVAAIDLSGYFLPAPGARRYDGGTVFWPGLVGMVESLRYLADVVGYDWIFERTRSITARARAVLRDQPGVSVLSPGDNVALTAFAVAGLSPRPIADALAERGIVVRTLAHPPALRISTGFFTGDDDLMRLAEAIEEIRHEG